MDSEGLFTQHSKRRMVYPYTLTAKMVQFPYKFYWEKVWGFKYYTIAVVICLPIFYKIQTLARTPENIKKWQEIRRKQFSGEPEH